MITTVNPRVDIAFKKIFGVEENKDLLISLINSIVSQEDQIRDVRLLNPYNPQNFKKDKLSILDVKAEGHNKKRYHIEIQLSDEGDYDKRALHNWAKAYTEQLGAGDRYKQLNKTIGIHILNFLSIPELPKYHNVFHLKEKDTHFQFFSDMELHTIELKKFEEKRGRQKEGLNIEEELESLLSKTKTALDMWVAFLTRHDLLDKSKLPQEIDNPNLRKALNVIEVMNMSSDERAAYESHLQWLRMEISAVEKAQADSEAIGREKGRLEIIHEMLAEGADIKFIARVTKLSEAEVMKLQKVHAN